MGKRGKHQKQSHRRRCTDFKFEQLQGSDLPSSAYDPLPHSSSEQESDQDVGAEEQDLPQSVDSGKDERPAGELSKFQLYQTSVQSPKGDISYLLKFFMLYVGGRAPIHLQEDFCGTAFLSTEWVKSDPRRTAIGVDLDLEALSWCFENNLTMTGAESCSQVKLFHGNVLQPQEAYLVKCSIETMLRSVSLEEDLSDAKVLKEPCSSVQVFSATTPKEAAQMKNCILPLRDIVCAFNYSCCCLHRRSELISYFRHVLGFLDKEGGIFVMDIYGGASSEQKLQLKRRFSNFTYIWDQAEFDVINRQTRISIHFQPRKKKILQHAFSYEWRLWSLPEIRDCMEEAGFQSVHFWIREMPDTQDSANMREYNASNNVKYEELSIFLQRDAWNAYIVGVKKKMIC